MEVEEGVYDELDLSWIDNFDFSDECFKSFSMDAFFQVDEHLGHIDNNSIGEFGGMQSLDFGLDFLKIEEPTFLDLDNDVHLDSIGM